ncbi:hypothetical protein WN944_001900 [Citrus x changshan-huyou]|uniref:Uncharacterized protein n=1 Tax=Citrus x changshan-huyou TaxID=2935761 RepID=A0AAP0QV97_9ROSI
MAAAAQSRRFVSEQPICYGKNEKKLQRVFRKAARLETELEKYYVRKKIIKWVVEDYTQIDALWTQELDPERKEDQPVKKRKIQEKSESLGGAIDDESSKMDQS